MDSTKIYNYAKEPQGPVELLKEQPNLENSRSSILPLEDNVCMRFSDVLIQYCRFSINIRPLILLTISDLYVTTAYFSYPCRCIIADAT